MKPIYSSYKINRHALKKAYEILAPFSDKQRWEFNNNLVHLNFITHYFPKNTRLLDAGSGIGILALALHLLSYQIDGADKYVFKKNSCYFIEDLPQLQRIWEAQGLKIFDKDLLVDTLEQKYDGIISVATIEHQKDPRLFLRSILAPLAKGGYLYLATPNVTNFLNRIRFLFGRPPLGNLKDFFAAGEDFDGHWREYSLNELHLFFVWLDIKVIMAKNVQSMKPSLRIKKFRDIYVNLFRFLGSLIPSCGDANILIGKIKQDGLSQQTYESK